MKMIIFSVYDVKAAVYTQPFYDVADASAVRSFKNTVSNADHAFGRNPEDFSLARIGQFDDQNAKLVNEDVEILITGLEAVAAGRQVAPGSLESIDIGEAQGSA